MSGPWCVRVCCACLMLSALLLSPVSVLCCTTILVGSKAAVGGGALVTHNNDCTDCDVRLAVIPAADHGEADTDSPIYTCKFGSADRGHTHTHPSSHAATPLSRPPCSRSSFPCPVVVCRYPRYVGLDRGETYLPSALASEALPGPFPVSVPIGHIRQVAHTFSYLEGSYPIANEWGLSMGESTCTSRLVAFGFPLGDALYDVTALMRAAMERCRSARCAVSLMGQLAEKGGFYGSNDPPEEGQGLFEESGEALTLIDSAGEAWVFHVLPDDTGRSAVWAAQRLQDDHFTVVGNKVSSNCTPSHTSAQAQHGCSPSAACPVPSFSMLSSPSASWT